MKDIKILHYSLLFMICSIIVSLYIILIMPIDKKIMYKEWYYYDNESGNYERLYISDKAINYNANYNTNLCNKYTYNTINKKITMNCGINIEIINSNDNMLILNVNDKRKIFYDNLDDTFNTEFEKYFNKSLQEYSDEKRYSLEYIKIDANNLINLLDEDGIIILKGNNCMDIECTLINEIAEYYIVNNKNTYYINSNEITDETLYKLNTKSDIFSINIDEYNKNNPVIINVKSGIIDIIDFKCNGFNCNSYKSLVK